jgi:serine/threonine protein kinase
MIGEIIDEFEILSELGAGGYGAVYRAHDKSVNRDVALKVILPQHANNPDFKQRFESEARLVAQLESRQIVPLYSYWQDERGAFLVMRYLRGGSLRRIIAKQGALSLAQTLRIASDIAEALAVAHECGVVHRDLKPENILVDERGNAYLSDFGIAKRISDPGNITEADAIVGTWAYLSPEQIQSIDVSPQSDIYTFGILLYELLAGKHPFQGQPVPMMIIKHLQEPLPHLSAERPELPQQLDDIIARATAKDATERYASALDLIADLKAVVNASNGSITPIQKAQPKKPTTAEGRNRYAMLQLVRKFWIEGVLENSLHGAALIELGMQQQSGKVENPWDTLLRTTDGDEERLTADVRILDIFERMNGKLLIMGDPGSGKTTTLLMLARDLLQRAEADEHHPLPVIFNLSSWSENRKPLEQWLVDELSGKYQVPRKVAEAWVAADSLLLLLDGLDEVANEVRNACVQAINAYRSEHGFVDMVVCSRTKDYDDLTQQLTLNGAVVIQPLDHAQILAYLSKLGADVAILRELIQRDEQLHELAHSPLMLSIMVLAYRGISSQEIPDFDDIDKQRQHLFEAYVKRMFNRRTGKQTYSTAETCHYLAWLAKKMQEHVLSVFHIEQMQPLWLSVEQRQRYYRMLNLIHIPFTILVFGLPCFLTAPLLGVSAHLLGLGMMLAGILAISTFTSDRWKRWYWHFSYAIVLGLVWGLSFGAVYGAVKGLLIGIAWFAAFTFSGLEGTRSFTKRGVNRDNIVVVELLHSSLKHIDLRSGIGGFILGMIAVLTYWLVVGVVTSPIQVALGISAGGAVYAAYYLFHNGLMSGEVELHSAPNQGMRASFSSANRGGLAGGLLQGLLGVFGFAPVTTLAFGLGMSFATSPFVSYVYWISFGGLPIIQHIVLRYVLHRDKLIPQNYARFLDYAASLILLRKVGGGYIFIHRYLLEYFATLYDDKQA